MTEPPRGSRGVLRGLVADVQPLWQSALSLTLRRLGFGSVDVCASAEEVTERIQATAPHLIVCDPDGLPGRLDLLDSIDGAIPRLLVVVSARAHELAVRSPSVATAFVSKRRTLAEIEQSLHDLVAERLDWGTLTKREIEILALVADGMSNRAIAKNLWLSAQTVKYHLTQAYRKLGVSDRRAAVERVRANGLLAERLHPLLADDLAASLRTIKTTQADVP